MLSAGFVADRLPVDLLVAGSYKWNLLVPLSFAGLPTHAFSLLCLVFLLLLFRSDILQHVHSDLLEKRRAGSSELMVHRKCS